MKDTITETVTRCDGCGSRLDTVPSFMYMSAGVNLLDFTDYNDLHICKSCAPTVLQNLMIDHAVTAHDVRKVAEAIPPNVVAV